MLISPNQEQVRLEVRGMNLLEVLGSLQTQTQNCLLVSWTLISLFVFSAGLRIYYGDFSIIFFKVCPYAWACLVDKKYSSGSLLHHLI